MEFIDSPKTDSRMLENVRKYDCLPEEIYSERNRIVDDRALAKEILFDRVRQ